MRNLLWPVAIGFCACDLPEGLAEERREVVEAAREGVEPQLLQEQLEDAGDALVRTQLKDERQLHRALDEMEIQIARARQEALEGKRQPLVEQEVQMVALSEAIAETRRQLTEPPSDPREPGSQRQARLQGEVELLRQRLQTLLSVQEALQP